VPGSAQRHEPGASLWIDQGGHRQTHDLLGPLYCRFTEGLETADLKAAENLLNEMTS
jgi:hypothetical protein